MARLRFCAAMALAGAVLPLAAAGQDVVFRSDVSLVRVDVQVVDRNNRAITGLTAADFMLREEGQPQEIRNFASEDVPVDVVLLLDVSGSMRSHVERIASASGQALRVLGNEDRVAIMVFDRATRLRLPFRNSREDVERELHALLQQETFDGGTDITRGLLDAANYIAQNARKEARRAIVILTDDQTGGRRDDEGVGRALARADTVLSALIAPDAMRGRMGRMGGGGSWPSGGPLGGPLGGIILGRRGPYGGRGGGGGPVILGSQTHSAGTAEIARSSGGDSIPVDQASAFEDTLARIRQRYALHFYLPPGVAPGQERNIEVELAAASRRRYPDAEVRFRRVYMAPGGPVDSEPTIISQGPPELKRRPPAPHSGQPDEAGQAQPASGGGGWRRVGPEPAASGTQQPAAGTQGQQPGAAPASADPPRTGGWRRVTELEPAPSADSTAPDASPAPSGGGWRKAQ